VRADNYSRKLQDSKVADGGREGVCTIAKGKFVVCGVIPSVQKGRQE